MDLEHATPNWHTIAELADIRLNGPQHRRWLECLESSRLNGLRIGYGAGTLQFHPEPDPAAGVLRIHWGEQLLMEVPDGEWLPRR